MDEPVVRVTQYAQVPPEKEASFNEWYDHHQQLIARIPGWSWAARYVGVRGLRPHLALYRVEGVEFARLVEGYPDPQKCHPLVYEGFLEKKRRNLDTLISTHNGIYSYLAGTSLNSRYQERPLPLAVELAKISDEAEPEWSRWCEKERLPRLMAAPGIAGATWLQRVAELTSRNPVKYLLLIQFHDRDAMRVQLGGPSSPLLQGGSEDAHYRSMYDVSADYYLPVAMRWAIDPRELRVAP